MPKRKNRTRRNDRISVFEKDRLHANSLNLGLGVQSTAMTLKVLNKELPRPDAIIFSDPMWEDEGSYENLERIRPMIEGAGIPFHIVSSGNIRENNITTGNAELPYYVNPSRYITIEEKMKLLVSDTRRQWYKDRRNAKRQGTLFPQKSLEETIHEACTQFGKKVQAGLIKSGWKEMKTTQISRQCTKLYKIEPVTRFLRENYGADAKTPVGQWLGITVDEWHRMTTSPIKAAVLMYPLIDIGMSREDCELYLEEQGFPVPVKSACVGCPYHSTAGWNNLTDAQIDDVADFEEGVLQMIANDPKLRYYPYFVNGARVHRSMVPIDERPFKKESDEDEGSPCMGQAGCFL